MKDAPTMKDIPISWAGAQPERHVTFGLICRIAGNIAAGLAPKYCGDGEWHRDVAADSVSIAIEIVREAAMRAAEDVKP